MSATASDRRPARQPRALRTRQAIVDAGRTLFSEKPIDAVAIDEIVQAAGVAKGSFYNHFADRDALVKAISKDVRDTVERAIAVHNRDVEDPARRLVRAVATYFRFALDDAERAGYLVRFYGGGTSLTAPYNKGLVDDISRGLREGRFTVPTVQSGVLFVLGVAHTTLVALLRDSQIDLAVSLSQQMCTLLLKGLGLDEPEAARLAAQTSEEIMRAGDPGEGAKLPGQ